MCLVCRTAYPVLFLILYNDMQTGKVPGNSRQCSQLLWTLPRKNWNHGWQQTHRAGLLWNQRIQHWTVGKASDQGKILINKLNCVECLIQDVFLCWNYFELPLCNFHFIKIVCMVLLLTKQYSSFHPIFTQNPTN